MFDEDATARQRIARIIVLMMEHKKMTGVQLAARFGVTPRSLYRDMRLIMDAGLPILGIAGDGYVWKPPPGSALLERP